MRCSDALWIHGAVAAARRLGILLDFLDESADLYSGRDIRFASRLDNVHATSFLDEFLELAGGLADDDGKGHPAVQTTDFKSSFADGMKKAFSDKIEAEIDAMMQLIADAPPKKSVPLLEAARYNAEAYGKSLGVQFPDGVLK